MAKRSGSQSCIYESPVGRLKLEATVEGICGVKWLKDDEGEADQMQSEGSDSGDHRLAKQHLKTCTSWLDAYFSGSLVKSPVPKPPLVIPMKGSFFHHVWSTLSTTGVGETLSYAELANLTGRPLAARAVGQAMKKHSIPILIPCHRVVKSGGGGMGNYSGGEGPSTKQWLLEHERKMLNTAP